MFCNVSTVNRLFAFPQILGSLCLSVALVAHAQVDETKNKKSLTDSPVLARTGAQTITVADIDFLLARLRGPSEARQLANQQPLSSTTQATAIELLALQRQALATLRKKQQAASLEEIESAIRAGATPEQSDWSIAQIAESYSEQYGIDAEKLHDSIDFRLAWPRYLQRHLTEENLRKHFAKQRQRFDGTRFKIDLITLIVPVGRSPLRDQAVQRLTDLRTELMAPQANWETIIGNTNGLGETTLTNGRWIKAAGDLVPGLITPLLELDCDQLSQPIHTTSGVHLIRWTETEAGKYELPEVRGDVRTHMLLHLLEYLAKQSADELPLVNLDW